MKNSKNPLIYLVEDDPIFRKMIDAYLKTQRLTHIKQFGSGEEMLVEFAKVVPDLVVEDYELGLGKLNGLEIFKKAKEIKPDISFIFLSGQSSIELAIGTIKEGAYDYVVKDDFAKENLLNRIKKFVFQKQLVDKQQVYKIAAISIIVSLAIILTVLYISGLRFVFT